MEYTKEYFIEKFEAIPEDRWITGQVERWIDGIQCHCALGWTGSKETQKGGWTYTDETLALIKLFGGDISDKDNIEFKAVFQVNDRFRFGSPKEAILNKLKSL